MKKPRRVPFREIPPDPMDSPRSVQIIERVERLVDAAQELEIARRELREARAELRAFIAPFLDGDV